VTEPGMAYEAGFNYVVEISTKDGTPVFKGTVSQKGDFVHLQKSMYGSVATLRVHDMLTAAKTEPLKLLPLDPNVAMA
jgi:hypothetical protein